MTASKYSPRTIEMTASKYSPRTLITKRTLSGSYFCEKYSIIEEQKFPNPSNISLTAVHEVALLVFKDKTAHVTDGVNTSYIRIVLIYWALCCCTEIRFASLDFISSIWAHRGHSWH